jgi:hypothetical protein
MEVRLAVQKVAASVGAPWFSDRRTKPRDQWFSEREHGCRRGEAASVAASFKTWQSLNRTESDVMALARISLRSRNFCWLPLGKPSCCTRCPVNFERRTALGASRVS